jgi:hypothetical protein
MKIAVFLAGQGKDRGEGAVGVGSAQSTMQPGRREEVMKGRATVTKEARQFTFEEC